MANTENLIEFVSYKTTWQHRKPVVAWSTHTQLIPEYKKHLDNLGLVDSTKASDEFLRAVELRDLAEQKLVDAEAQRAAAVTRNDISARLASGDLSPADAEKIKWVDPREIAQRTIDQARYTSIASTTTLNSAVGAIHSFGDDKWISILKPLAAKAIVAKDQHKFDTVHAFAQFLRQPHVAGLAAAMSDHLNDAESDYYMFARPDLVHRWRVERCLRSSPKHLHVLSTEPLAENWWRMAHELRPGAPFPTIKEFESDWKAGLYSAQDAIDNVLISLDAQEQEFRRVMAPDSPEPTAKKRRVVVI